jgi:hypothetical protein
LNKEIIMKDGNGQFSILRTIRITPEQETIWEEEAERRGMKSVVEYIRFACDAMIGMTAEKIKAIRRKVTEQKELDW